MGRELSIVGLHAVVVITVAGATSKRVGKGDGLRGQLSFEHGWRAGVVAARDGVRMGGWIIKEDSGTSKLVRVESRVVRVPLLTALTCLVGER